MVYVPAAGFWEPDFETGTYWDFLCGLASLPDGSPAWPVAFAAGIACRTFEKRIADGWSADRASSEPAWRRSRPPNRQYLDQYLPQVSAVESVMRGEHGDVLLSDLMRASCDDLISRGGGGFDEWFVYPRGLDLIQYARSLEAARV